MKLPTKPYLYMSTSYTREKVISGIAANAAICLHTGSLRSHGQ